jgi:hypothetical protein
MSSTGVIAVLCGPERPLVPTAGEWKEEGKGSLELSTNTADRGDRAIATATCQSPHDRDTSPVLSA